MIENILIFFAIFLLLIYAIDFAIHSTRAGKIFDEIPGPKTLPVLGNVLDFLRSPTKLFYLGRYYINIHKTIFRTWGFHTRIVNIYSPQDIEVILSSQKHITKSYVYDFLHPWLKEGLLTSGGEKWQKRRKILTPAFHFNILQEFCYIFEKNGERLIRKLQKVCDKEINIVPYITSFALHSICETAMGTDLETVHTDEMKKYKSAIFEMGHNVVHRLVRAWLHPPFLFWLSPSGQNQSKSLSVLHDFSTNVIRKRRNEKKMDIDEDTTQFINNGQNWKPKNKKMAMLDLLLSAEEIGIIDEEGIREEVDTFMFEGHDTTAMATTFCLMELANNRDIQDLAYEEVKEIFKNPLEPITVDKLNQLKYLERCIKEALRLYPSVVMIGRNTYEDVKLPKYVLPAGTICHIHIFDLHRNSDIYPNPFKFDPDRFLLENCIKRHPFAYIPFSAGPRNCIGQKFAILEEKVVLSSILQNFILEPVTRPQDLIFSADLVLRNAKPITIKLIPRI